MNDDEYLKVLMGRSELHRGAVVEIFTEGPMSAAAKERYQSIKSVLDAGFLEQKIEACRSNLVVSDLYKMNSMQQDNLDGLVDSITSEVGRALVGLSVLQLVVKCIAPGQSIRLHKGSLSTKRDFSWQEGISLRSLDKKYITPVLRKYDLLRLNADGFMMTRSLAENYPYTSLYKANLRGARMNWLLLVEAIEKEEIVPSEALEYILSRLLNSAASFKVLAADIVAQTNELIIRHGGLIDKNTVDSIIRRHSVESAYAARLMEISMHALMQAAQKLDLVGKAALLPLSQMRSANKKHSNIGDIELAIDGTISESWDAKYGKTYLKDELEELDDKLQRHHNVQVAGFVTSGDPDKDTVIIDRCNEIKALHGTEIEICSYKDWISRQFSVATLAGIDTNLLATEWLIAYVESIAQIRRQIAPIDEPCEQWLRDLGPLL